MERLMNEMAKYKSSNVNAGINSIKQRPSGS